MATIQDATLTEIQWLECANPSAMLNFLQNGSVVLVDELPTEAERQAVRRFLQSDIIPRKMALFACACCRRIWPAATDERSRRAIEVVELFVDEPTSKDQLNVAAHDANLARGVEHKIGVDRAEKRICRVAANACWNAALSVWSPRGFRSSIDSAAHESAVVATWSGLSVEISDEKAAQAKLLRCLVGNPFRPVEVDAEWLAPTGKLANLAQCIYDERAFDRLPILADALEEDGCTNTDILAHCRSEGPHVRGCWVVDLIIGKQ